MRITQVHIDHFAGWRDTTLHLPAEDMHVLYGPNETGKSTLLEFLRGMLYGFSERDRFAPGVREQRVYCAGRLHVTHGDQNYVIHRESASLDTGGVRLTDEHGRELPDSVLADLLSGVNAETYRNVFALGLPELQEVSTLSADEVAEHVYQVSLGPTGRRLLEAHKEASRRRRLFLNEENMTGSIVSLARQLEQVDELIDSCEQDARRAAPIKEELHRIELELQDQKRRQQGLSSQLKGHEFMERIAGPWNRKRQLQEELERLPRVAGIPEGGLERLDQWEQEIHDLSDRKRSLVKDARRLAKTAAGLSADTRLARHASTIRELLKRRNEIVDLQSKLPELQVNCEQARKAADEAVAGLGEEWSQQRVETADDTPAAAIELFRRARRYRKFLDRRAREVRRYQRIASRLQQRQIELAQRLKPLDAADAAEARESCAEQMTLLQAISGDEARAQSLEQSRDESAAELSAHGESRLLPPYFFAVLAAFGILGLVLLIAGVMGVLQGATGHTPWLVGLIFVLMGAACGGVTWTVKRHFDPDKQREHLLKDRLQRTTDELAELQHDLTRNRSAVWGAADLMESPSRSSGDRDTAGRLESTRRQLIDLDGLLRDEESVKAGRVSLSRFRERIRQTQRTLSAERREWCQALKAAGLEESVRIDPALDQWRAVAEAKRLLHEYQSIADQFERAQQTAAEFRATLAQLATRIDGDDAAAGEIGSDLANWEQRLARFEALRRQRAELRHESRRKRRGAEQEADQISDLQRQRLEHLAATGAADRDEFRGCVQSYSRRLELERELSISDEELTEAAQSEPELAVVEEDLRAFDRSSNRVAIEAIRCELADLSGDLEANREQFGRLRQELNQLESDRRLASLRFARAESRHQLAEELEGLCAIDLARRALDHARVQLESTHQPQTLASAGDFLSQLTEGRYRRVWTRLGERVLFVDEEGGGALDVERLSAGAREQLFLAIRLALLDKLRERGVRLPVILDDVLVNFDEDRTEAAITTLRHVAASGQQILIFTCHQHLAERFGRAGVSTIQLPVRSRSVAQRRVG